MTALPPMPNLSQPAAPELPAPAAGRLYMARRVEKLRAAALAWNDDKLGAPPFTSQASFLAAAGRAMEGWKTGLEDDLKALLARHGIKR